MPFFGLHRSLDDLGLCKSTGRSVTPSDSAEHRTPYLLLPDTCKWRDWERGKMGVASERPVMLSHKLVQETRLVKGGDDGSAITEENRELKQRR